MVKNIFKNSKKLFERQQSSILSAASVITTAIFASSLLGFLKTRLLVSNFFQAIHGLPQGAALDAYWVAFRIPDFIFQLLVIGALSAAFIPVFSKYAEKDEDEAFQIANSMINIIVAVFLVLSIIIFIFANQLNQLFTGPNFSPAQLELASNFTRIMILAQVFFAVSNFLTGIIQAKHRFLIPALSPLVYNLGIITGILTLGDRFGLYSAAIGVVFGAFLHLALQVPLALKLGFRYAPIVKLKHPGVREMGKLMLPRTLALSVNQLELFITTFLATALTQGSYTIIILAQTLMNFPVRVFGVPIGQASLPFLSQDIARQKLEKFKTTFFYSFYQILYLALPATAVLIVLRIPLVRIIYGAKDFPWTATLLTGKTAAVLALAIVAHASTHLLTRTFYALHNTTIPLVSAIFSLAIFTATSFYFVFNTDLGVIGLAIGSTVSAFFQILFLLVALKFKLPGLNFSKTLITPIKILTASTLTGLFLWVPLRILDQFFFDTTRTLNLVLLTISVSLIGATVYYSLSRVFRIEQLNAYLGLAKRLGNWKKVLAQSEETIDTSEAAQ